MVRETDLANEMSPVIPEDSKDFIASPHVLMIPFPAQPHIIPMLSLAHQLVESGGARITVTLVSVHKLIHQLQQAAEIDPAIHLVGVPDDQPTDMPSDLWLGVPVVLRQSFRLKHNMESFVDTLLEDRQDFGGHRPTCLVADTLNWWAGEFATRLRIPTYLLSCSPAIFLLALLKSPKTGFEREDRNLQNIFVDDSLPLMSLNNLPGCVRSDESITVPMLGRYTRSVEKSHGVIVNTSLVLESEVIEALRSQFSMPVMPVGPLMQPLSSRNVSTEGLPLCSETLISEWLDQQPSRSVVYVCFATTGMFNLTKRHVNELAKGLEGCEQRFVWVLRSPPDVTSETDLLPLGFEEKVQGRGLILRGWAPQLKILDHSSTGAFLTACGWNSAIESLMRGVPLITWPSFADQPINSRYLEAKLGVALEIPQEEERFVRAEEIEKAVRVVLLSEEGKAMRKRAETCGRNLLTAMAPGGSSHTNLQQFAFLVRKKPIVFSG